MRKSPAAFLLVVFFLSFPMACPILAGPIEDSVTAYRRGDYMTAYQLIKPEAEKGNDVAQFILGFMYDEGKGVPQDYAEAAKWYGRAAKQGNKSARRNLELMDDQDQVSKDRAEMRKWHRKAAEPKNAAARSGPGPMEDKSQLSKDRAGMPKWHRGAAEPGDAATRSGPGPMEDKDQRSNDRAEVQKWYRRAAE